MLCLFHTGPAGDQFEITDCPAYAEQWAATMAKARGVVCWGVSRVTVASEPHWIDPPTPGARYYVALQFYSLEEGRVGDAVGHSDGYRVLSAHRTAKAAARSLASHISGKGRAHVDSLGRSIPGPKGYKIGVHPAGRYSELIPLNQFRAAVAAGFYQ